MIFLLLFQAKIRGAMIEKELSMDDLKEPHHKTTRGGIKNFIWIHTAEDR